jgi:hypothetical protein
VEESTGPLVFTLTAVFDGNHFKGGFGVSSGPGTAALIRRDSRSLGSRIMDTRGGESSRQDTGRGTAVEFVYQPMVADFEEAIRGRARRTWAGRVQVLTGPLAAVAALLVFSVLRDFTLPVLIISLVLSLAATSWGAVRGLRTMARRMFSVMEAYGQCRMVADERGVVSTGERASFTVDWTVFREYLETPGLFVLLGGDRAAGVAVLPKRGAQNPEDVDRLRAILDRNLKRL